MCTIKQQNHPQQGYWNSCATRRRRCLSRRRPGLPKSWAASFANRPVPTARPWQNFFLQFPDLKPLDHVLVAWTWARNGTGQPADPDPAQFGYLTPIPAASNGKFHLRFEVLNLVFLLCLVNAFVSYRITHRPQKQTDKSIGSFQRCWTHRLLLFALFDQKSTFMNIHSYLLGRHRERQE